MSGEENMAVNNEDTADDLEQVNDIGSGFAKALHTLGIRTFAGLAGYTPEKLAEVMTEDAGIKVTPDRIKTRKWIEQAKKLAAKKQQALENLGVEEEEEHHGWKQHAGFSIFFDYKLDEQGHKLWHTRVWKTTTYHEESGEVKELDGVETSSWVNWILEKSGLDAERVSGSPMEEKISEQTMLSPVYIEIQNVKVTPAISTVKQVVNATVFLKVLPAKGDVELPESIAFQLELHTTRIDTGVSEFVGQTQLTVETVKTECVANIDFPIPQENGRYKLRITMYLLNQGNVLVENDDFVFNVVP